MFSGHTIIFVISALVWTSHGYHRFPRRLRWLAWICLLIVWALCFGSAIIVIANRAHYTVDVMVAFYVAGGNFYIWTYVFDHYIEERGRLRDLTRPWGEGPDPRPHIQARALKHQDRGVIYAGHYGGAGEGSDAEKVANGGGGGVQDEVQMLPIVSQPVTYNSNLDNKNVGVSSSYQLYQQQTVVAPLQDEDVIQVVSEGRPTLQQPPLDQRQLSQGSEIHQLPGEPYDSNPSR